MDVPLLYEIVTIFLLSIFVTVTCNKIKLPATVGFLLTGVLCGPSLLGIVSDREAIDHVAEIGVAMLLFTIGMELSGEALNRLKRPVFLGGSLQIGLTVLAVMGLALLGGYSYQQGVFMGCLVALSSSAIVLRIMQERGSTNTPTGRLSLAILVFQDIMVAPMLLCVPLLSGTLDLSLESAFFSTLWVVLALGGVLLFARFGLDRLMEAVVRTRTREILLLTTLGLCLGMALLTNTLGLSLSLGAFMAGLLLARSQYSMSVIAGILPYRDVFMSLFFISVGMMLNVDFFGKHFFSIIGLTALFIVIKSLLTLPAVLVQGYPLRAAIITSLSLAQVGEFAFVLAASGLSAGLFDMDAYQNFLDVSVLTMMLTPGLMAIAPRLADRFTGQRNNEQQEESGQQEGEKRLEDHLIIVGFGISGKHLAHVAKESGIEYTILEMNPETVSRYRHKEPIAHGDASQPVVLEHLGVTRARVLVIVISDPSAVRAITIEARRFNPNLHIIARTRFVTEVAALRRLGADEVIAEEFETSIEVFTRVLSQYLVPRQDIDTFAARIRQENYRMIRLMSSAVDSLDSIVNRLPDMGVQTMRLGGASPLCGRSLAQTELRRRHGVTVIAILREGVTHASPGADEIFEPGDIVYLFGKTDKIIAITPLFSGPVRENARDGKGGMPQPARPTA
ncbi:cation:proton antiporter [Desulfovibrio sp.]|uniref:cation:proton antiporter domain-containing protein n=1 Tax=Desulfovibrio sp. TaxID=885 RepID=UPI0025C1A28E|nr:cation:proton antiporter [Desulfovibrio sp.]